MSWAPRTGAVQVRRAARCALAASAAQTLRQCAIGTGRQTIDTRTAEPADASPDFKLSFYQGNRSQQRTTSVT
jgi:hypothetical protein